MCSFQPHVIAKYVKKKKNRMKNDRCTVWSLVDEFIMAVKRLFSFVTFYCMFVGNRLTAFPWVEYMYNLVATSIEAFYLILRCPDKMCNQPIGINCVLLGIHLLTKHLEISIEDCNVECPISFLQETWNKQHKFFTAINTACLISSVLACTQVC